MKRREFLGLALTATGATMLAACASSPSAAGTGGAGTNGPIGKLEGPTVVTDTSKFPKSFKEAPQLSAMVEGGKLPSVTARIGKDPLVISPVHQVGKFGGTLHRAFTGVGDFQNGNRSTTGPDSLLYWDYQFKKVVPFIAKGFEVSGDGKSTTLHLRQGMRWSDGQPFTADDIMFWYQDMYLDKDLVRVPSATLSIGGKQGTIEKLDDSTVRYSFASSYPLFPGVLASWGDLGGHTLMGSSAMGGFAPAHYLKQFHPRYTAPAELDQKAKAAGFPGWVAQFLFKNTWYLNPDLPVLSPWKTTQPANTNTWVLERNPYSVWVDTAGNQLPYVDTVSMTQVPSLEALNLQAASGTFDYQDRNLDPAKLTVLVQNQKKGGYTLHVDPSETCDFAFRINLSYEADPEIGDWLRNVDFRRALSLGINRDDINQTFFSGLGTPSSIAPSDDNKYFPGPKYRTLWATHDPKRANQMLDSLGLTKKDADGYRLRKDGSGRLQLACQATNGGSGDFQNWDGLVREQWKQIGIFLDVQLIDSGLQGQRDLNNQTQLTGIGSGSEEPFLAPQQLFPSAGTGPTAELGALYATWFLSDGASGKEPPARMVQVMNLWKQGRTVSDQERIKLGKQIWEIIVEDVFQIGVICAGPNLGVRVAKNTLGNVSDRVVNATTVHSPENGLPQTLFFK